VLASDIAGNRGLLGGDYAGLFPVGDEAALADLMRRAAGDSAWLAQLAQGLGTRRPLFDPVRETESWRRLLSGLHRP
jgi:hypothetical protein